MDILQIQMPNPYKISRSNRSIVEIIEVESLLGCQA
uniref:Uncharacterized protein n=1 Tax=Arundo donax TaxID=35708 RepID=A0A0A9BZ72_ARUDO